MDSDFLLCAAKKDRKLSEAWPQWSYPLHQGIVGNGAGWGQADRILFVAFLVEIGA